jgi:hypothetical protein
MLYLTNTHATEDELQLQKLLFEKEMIKDYYKYFPNTTNYLRILSLNSEIACRKRKISRNVKK